MKYFLVKCFRLKIHILVISCLYFLSSCIDAKKAVYFNNIRDTTFRGVGANLQQIVQKNDLLSISVSSLNPEATIIFNTPNIPTVTSGSASGGSTQMTGYLVSEEGTILFPLLGTISVAGLTKKAISDTITNRILRRRMLIDPIVNVRFLNFRVTVLGEVARPTVVSVPNEKISVLEALGMAGDLTIYAKRDNVLLIREEDGNKTVKRIDLNSSNILASPYYYLKTNDVIYAEPNKARVASSERSQQLIPIVLSGLSFLVIIIDRLLR
jgi:polysaccharide biosynthesis/export protein